MKVYLIFQFSLDLEPSGCQNMPEYDIVYFILNVPVSCLTISENGP